MRANPPATVVASQENPSPLVRHPTIKVLKLHLLVKIRALRVVAATSMKLCSRNSTVNSWARASYRVRKVAWPLCMLAFATKAMFCRHSDGQAEKSSCTVPQPERPV